MNKPLPISVDEHGVARIDFARHFSRYLGPRYVRLGSYSGEQFLNEILLPMWDAADRIVIDLDSFETSGPSFFDEAFGGLVRRFGLAAVDDKVELFAVNRAYLLPRIEGWMRETEAQRVGR